ncbi:MAG: methyltransferase [Candidatus Lokiarchaeota archaeon]|nr:methyltransferase [Candidatus Lokiarchaeota archaeon]
MTDPDHYFSSNPDSPENLRKIKGICRNREFEFYSAAGVFSANKIDTGTSVLLKNLNIPDEGVILDMGCGIGVVGVVLGVLYPNLEIHFLDINARATLLAKKNAQFYDLKAYSTFTGDIMQILKENHRFYDGIYFNPPIRLGKKVYLNQILNAISFLKVKGVMDIVIKKKLGAESVYNYLENNLESQFQIVLLGKNSGYWVFEIQRIED